VSRRLGGGSAKEACPGLPDQPEAQRVCAPHGISISLDGFIAGPNQSEENPLGLGGVRLHEWIFGLAAWRQPHGQEGGEVNASPGSSRNRSRTLERP